MPAPIATDSSITVIAACQHLSIRCTERLADAGIEPSVGSVGDSYDNALAESVIGLYKTEVIRRQGPWRHLEAVEFATLAWVDWFNTRRLLEPIGYVPRASTRTRTTAVRRPSRLQPWGPESCNRVSDEPGAVHIRLRLTPAGLAGWFQFAAELDGPPRTQSLASPRPQRPSASICVALINALIEAEGASAAVDDERAPTPVPSRTAPAPLEPFGKVIAGSGL